jgi:hypothetical protein
VFLALFVFLFAFAERGCLYNVLLAGVFLSLLFVWHGMMRSALFGADV